MSSPLRTALGSDEKSHVTDYLARELEARGHIVSTYGALAAGDGAAWPEVAAKVASEVSEGHADDGILLCWTGTGVTMAANKVAGIRAALCGDAETARGARAWNDANVLCLSLRTTTESVAGEILDAWFGTTADDSEAANVRKLNELDATRAEAAPVLK